MRRKIKSLFTPWSIGGLILGAVGGYVYYALVGCRGESCPIWSNPWYSVGWGALLGYLLGGSIPSGKNRGSRMQDKDSRGD